MSVAGVESTRAAVGRMASGQATLKRTVGEVMGSVFYGKLLAQMRDSKIKGAYGHGGRGEEVFTQQLHGMLANEIGVSGNDSLRDAIFKRLSRQQELIDKSKLEKGQEVSQ